MCFCIYLKCTFKNELIVMVPRSFENDNKLVDMGTCWGYAVRGRLPLLCLVSGRSLRGGQSCVRQLPPDSMGISAVVRAVGVADVHENSAAGTYDIAERYASLR